MSDNQTPHLAGPNSLVIQRTQNIKKSLMSLADSDKAFPAASKGDERELFVSQLLEVVLPTIYRIGTGVATDSFEPEKRSGQLDVVIEMPFAPSFAPQAGMPRLYPAEAIGTAIEVKSDVAKQWPEVETTAEQLAPLRQVLGGFSAMRGGASLDGEEVVAIPLVAFGYTGWATSATAAAHLVKIEADALMILDADIFVTSDRIGQAWTHEFLLDEKRMQGGDNDRNYGVLGQISRSDKDAATLADELNRTQRQCHHGFRGKGGREFRKVGVGEWTPELVYQARAVFDRRVTVHEGPTAFPHFIDHVLRLITRRHVMTFDMAEYLGLPADPHR